MDIDRLYVSRKGGRELAKVQDRVHASIHWREGYMKKAREKTDLQSLENNTDNKSLNRIKITRKQKMGRKTIVLDISNYE